MIEVINLNLSYKRKKILKNLNFALNQGDTLSILGANGSGKSTLLRAMLGFLAYEGEIKIDGKSVRSYAKKELAALIAYVAQTHALSYEYSVLDIVLMGALHRTGLFSNFSAADVNLALNSLEKMGILELKNEPYTKISGGQRQLAYIARALTQKARIIFMDEPTTGLDFGNQIKLLEMMKMLKDDGYTFVQTTHYPRHAQFVSNLVLLLKNGEILKFGRCDELINSANIDKIYGINYEKYADKL